MCDDRVLDELIEQITPALNERREIIFVAPTPAFDQPSQIKLGADGKPVSMNVLPRQFAAYLATQLGGSLDHQITQAARIGRTALVELERFLWQPVFVGTVDPAAAYVIVDDVLTLGATIASLRSHIIRGKGTVCAAVALAHRTGRDQDLALSAGMWERLVQVYGEEISAFWSREIGHDASSLTEAEASRLCRWAGGLAEWMRDSALQRLRDRLFEAAGGNSQQARPRRGRAARY